MVLVSSPLASVAAFRRAPIRGRALQVRQMNDELKDRLATEGAAPELSVASAGHPGRTYEVPEGGPEHGANSLSEDRTRNRNHDPC